MSERLVSAMNGSCARLAFKIFSPDALPEVQSCADNSNRVLTERLPVILLHGITSVKEAWDNCGAAIANRIRTKVYSLDARNHGESEWTDKIDFIKMADDVAGFMDSMGMPKAILIGHSMGGKTAMCFALRHRSDVSIAYKEYSSREVIDSRNAPILLLHGVTNAKETWAVCAQEIAQRTSSKVYCLDARNHGDSGRAYTMVYDCMAEDVVRFMEGHEIPKAAIVGHSMGGKTGMAFALKYPEKLELLVIEDISVRSSSSSRIGVVYYMKQIKDVLKQIPRGTELTEAKRFVASYLSGGEAAAKRKLEESVIAPRVWDGRDLPLVQTPSGEYEWKTNLDVIVDTMQSGKWSPVSSVGIYEGPVLSIYGTKSPFKVLEDKEEFVKQFPKTIYAPIQDGTHSLHCEYPEIFTNLVCDFILEQRASLGKL